jgi:HEAT repeat protein
VVRGLAAVALRDVEPAASAPALETLTKHLADPDENVRMMTAQAIARQGPRAKSALPALIALAQKSDQHPHVLRSVADALGLIGPDAREALPALRELWKIPRVRWAADLAIKRIEAR